MNSCGVRPKRLGLAVMASMKSETASIEISSGMSAFVEIGILLNADAGE